MLRRRLCDQESARLQRPPRNQLDVVCGTGLYRLGGTFLGLYQVRRVAGESDEDREVRLQALRTISTTGTCGECVSDCCEFHSDLFFFSLDCQGTDPGHVSLQGQ